MSYTGMTPTTPWCGLLLAAALLFPAVTVRGQNRAGATTKSARDNQALVFIGTYTGQSKGIYACRMNLENGNLSSLSLTAETANPTFLALHPNHRFLYAANEVGRYEGKPAGSVSAFSIDPETGKLSLLNRKTSGGAGPCHLSVDASGHYLLVANYGGGSVETLPIDRGRPAGRPGRFCSTPWLECEQTAAGRPPRPLHHDRSGQPVRPRLRPGPGQDSRLSLQRRQRQADSQRSPRGFRGAGRGAASPGLRFHRSPRLCDQ